MEKRFVVEKQDQAASKNKQLAKRLTTMINQAFRSTESGMWQSTMQRTNADDIVDFIQNGEMVCVYKEAKIAGCMRLQRITEEIAEIGMLAVGLSQQGLGIGRSLVQFGEAELIAQGYKILQIELLKPKAYTDDSREKLQQWYERLGYNQVKEEALEEVLPELVSGLKVPSKFTVLHKYV